MVDNFGVALDQIAGVDLRMEYLRHGPSLPTASPQKLFAGKRSGLTLIVAGGLLSGLVQPTGDGVQSIPLIGPLEYLADHRGGHRVNDKLVAVIRRFQIPVWGPAPDKLSVPHGLTLLGLDLPSNVDSVSLVNHIAEREHDAGAALRISGIELVINGDKTHMMYPEILLDVIPGVDSVPAQAG